ncbi:oligo-1,6-glucosidase [Mammaliicoccus sciuri]|uniref:alpha-glucosidase n=1 Tax=Mammaliicoccus sciuri TaxID=1296 RepID=UPI0007345DCA|nr:alpha-glucosidase [Mammaliicoccus sciuri]KTT84047.1 oligo-1,6-glucosidase [Mammaliicoccus sciuri]KTT90128.1 oligo-1,6-glucosidase [Mammaliicoccus sciuri]KTT91491.1 oligo-1,6-glucosidase [Mammaliicoccus sciuri]KTT94925.1 oligo-1,6-glucosidase [Mammaliicoccus sciuri]KTW14295.1 oligo-1,6-glucosidase [Mammaliicoccus sciuri]
MEERIWWKEAVCYQVYPRSFNDSNNDGIGDINGIREKLDYLKDLGIDVIWVSPIFKSPNDDNGYDISDYQDIMDEFGTMEDFELLLKETHDKGMKLILDLVINHTSDEHPWFIESKSSKDNPKRDWYIWQEGKDGKEPNNWGSIFNGSAWERTEETDEYYLHIFSKKQPDLNWENEAVRSELYNMINWWFDKGIDGFRVDAITHIQKSFEDGDIPVEPGDEQYKAAFERYTNRPGILNHLRELRDETFNKYDIMTVGEANGVSPDDANDWVGFDNGIFNMIFQFEHLGLWNTEDSGFDVIQYKNIMSKWQDQLEGVGWNALFIENHDQPRLVSTWGDDEHYWYESATSHATNYFLQKGTPFIYQGQEIGMTNYPFESLEDFNDVSVKNEIKLKEQNGEDTSSLLNNLSKVNRDNSRSMMQWDNRAYAGFSTTKPWFHINPNYKTINVAGQLEDEHSVLNYYKRLIQLKKDYDVFNYGKYELVDKDHKQIYSYKRILDNEEVIIMSNLTSEKATITYPLNLERSKLLLHNYITIENTNALEPFETRVYRIEE